MKVHKAKSIIFVISSLRCGGAERVVSALSNFLVNDGYKITIITIAQNEEDFFYLEDTIIRICLLKSNNENNKINRKRALNSLRIIMKLIRFGFISR